MKTVLIVIGAFFLLFGGGFVIELISANNTSNTFEQAIPAGYSNNENILAQYGQKIGEAIGVANLQAKAVKDIITGANDSRYGPDGSKAVMQWITEQNPNLDQATFKKVADMVESGRNEFQDGQTTLLDKKQAYKTLLGAFPSGMFARMLGYPVIKIGFRGQPDDYPIVSTARASGAFKTHIEQGNVLDPNASN